MGLGLGAGLGGEGEGQLFARWLSNDDLLLLDGDRGILKLGNIEALVLNLVLALDLGDLDGLGDADLLGGGVGELAGLFLGLSDQGNSVGLGLVFFTAVLVLSASITLMTISRGVAGGHLHGLRLVSIGDLGGGAGGGHIISGILVGADLPVNNGGGFLADGQHTVKAVVVVNHDLGGQGDRGNLLSEGRDTDLSVDGGVGVTAVVLRRVARGICRCQGNKG